MYCNTCLHDHGRWSHKSHCYDSAATQQLLTDRPPSGSRAPPRTPPKTSAWNQPLKTTNAEEVKEKVTALTEQIRDLEGLAAPSGATKAHLESLRSQLEFLQPKDPPPSPKPTGKELDQVEHKIRVQLARTNKSKENIDWYKKQLEETENGLKAQEDRLAELRSERDAIAARIASVGNSSLPTAEVLAFRPLTDAVRELANFIAAISDEYPCERVRPALTRVQQHITKLAPETNDDDISDLDIDEDAAKPFRDAVQSLGGAESDVGTLMDAMRQSVKLAASARREQRAQETGYQPY